VGGALTSSPTATSFGGVGPWAGRIIAWSAAPADGLWHRTARFASNATYRISAVVRGAYSRATGAYIKFRSERSSHALTWSFSTTDAWRRVTGRVTLGNNPDYRLILGTEPNSTIYVLDFTVVREDGASLGFESGQERRSWEYVGDSYVTSWGIDGSNDFSGVVVGPCPAPGRWGLRNRYVGLRANRSYEATFTARHVSGQLSHRAFISVQNLAGNEVLNDSWTFTSAGQRLDRQVAFATGNDQGHTVTFGTSEQLKYMVDNIRIREV
jgi:hypothetical protein